MVKSRPINRSILDLIGNTPLVRLSRINPNPRVELLAKLEGQNPGGSVKDRPALFMIRGACARGELRRDLKLIEATSGNTGIALAMIARQMSVAIELVMPEGSTIERIKTMRAFGAEVTLTPAVEGIEGSIDYVKEKERSGSFLVLNQFSNPDNPRAHYETTAPEIWRDTGETITHFIASMGTTGTIMGTSRFLKEKNPHIQIIGVQPDEGAQIPGIRKWSEEYLPKFYDRERVDRLFFVNEVQAASMTRRLAEEEGIFAGLSSGGAVFAAAQVAQELTWGVLVCIICDRGDRYLSSSLFA